jgi:hypothetical protein
MLPQMMALTGKGVTANNNYHKFVALQGFTVVGMSLCPFAFTGAPSGFNVDLNDDGVGVVAAVAANATGTVGEWKSSAVGGSADPVTIARGSVVSVDLNFAGGTSPAAEYTLLIWYVAAAD